MIVAPITSMSSPLRGFVAGVCAFEGYFLYCGNSVLWLNMSIIIGEKVHQVNLLQIYDTSAALPVQRSTSMYFAEHKGLSKN